jgi:hypothetical protein
MMRANWAGNPHVHMVELDFVPGRFMTKEEPDSYREMWCGLALGVLLPEKRSGEVIIHENESLIYATAFRHSVHRFQKWWNPAYSVPNAVHSARRAAARFLRTHAPGLFQAIKARRHGTA